jgi:hypothetical protein
MPERDKIVIADPDGRYACTVPSEDERGVGLWTTCRIKFGSEMTPEHRRMKAVIAPVVQSIQFGPGESMRGVFVSDDLRGTQPDAENIVYYNFRPDRAGERDPFALAPARVSFERSYHPAPACPVDLQEFPRYFHSWRAAEPSDGFASWTRGETDPVAEWVGVTTPAVSGFQGGIQVWRAMVEQREQILVRPTLDIRQAHYALDISLEIPAEPRPPLAVDVLKGCFDGAIASFQRFRPEDVDCSEILGRLEERAWSSPITADELVRLTHDELGTTLFDEAPFNKNGLNPCDGRCVAGSLNLNVVPEANEPSMTGLLYAVTPRGPG